jgi:exopolysaccharide biosynthesis polyprenyl glycosylphosphotransferase
MSAVIVYMFFRRELFDSRFIVLTGWAISILYIIVGRMILRLIQNITLRYGLGTHKLIIIGNNNETQSIIENIKNHREYGYKLITVIPTITPDTIAELKTLHQKNRIDEILQADSTISRSHSIELINFCEENNIVFKYSAGTFEARTTNIDVHMIAGIPVVEMKKTKLDGWGRVAKRLLDFIVSLLLIVILSPVLLIIALAVRLESRGPIIYKNERVSKNGIFNVYKFRSMYGEYCVGKQFAKYYDQKKVLEFEQELISRQSKRQGPVYKVLDDPRRTIVGRFIERTSLDELPQLFNVFLGNMSLVGPRPHQPREVEKYEPDHKRVLDIKPGVTGLAQISGRSDLDFDEEVKLDTYYIENWSMGLDLWILFKTPFAVIWRKAK